MLRGRHSCMHSRRCGVLRACILGKTLFNLCYAPGQVASPCFVFLALVQRLWKRFARRLRTQIGPSTYFVAAAGLQHYASTVIVFAAPSLRVLKTRNVVWPCPWWQSRWPARFVAHLARRQRGREAIQSTFDSRGIDHATQWFVWEHLDRLINVALDPASVKVGDQPRPMLGGVCAKSARVRTLHTCQMCVRVGRKQQQRSWLFKRPWTKLQGRSKTERITHSHPETGDGSRAVRP